MSEKPTFLPADPLEQFPLQCIWEARDSAQREAALVTDLLDQVERLRGPSATLGELRTRLGSVIPNWVGLSERGEALVAEWSELTRLHDRAVTDFQDLATDIMGFLSGLKRDEHTRGYEGREDA